MDKTTITVGWYCGYYVGPPKWRMAHDWVYEPDECGTEFETEEDRQDWEDEVCQVECPTCGATLYQTDDAPWTEEDDDPR